MLTLKKRCESKSRRTTIVFLGILCLIFSRIALAGLCDSDQLSDIVPHIPDLKSVQVSAMKGDANAQLQLGEIYFNGGKGVKKDTKEAIHWLEKSAAQGNREAQCLLGYYYAVYVKNYEAYSKAAHLFKQSSDHGCHAALFYLGVLTLHGYGVKKNPKAGFQMAEESAKSGYTEAQIWLGTMLITGEGVKKDVKSGFVWIKRAADAGSSAAELALANLYLSGLGTHKDPKAALSLLESVYAKKDFQAPTAAYYIGWMYMEGKGVPVDAVKALSWMYFASVDHISDSEQRVKTLVKQLPEQKLVKDCEVRMAAFPSTDKAKGYRHIISGENVIVLETRKTSYVGYLPAQKTMAFIPQHCLQN